MNKSFKKEYLTSFVAKNVWYLIHIMIPLFVGRFFGIVAERVAYCLVIMRLSLSFLEAVEVINMASRFSEGFDDDEIH